MHKAYPLGEVDVAPPAAGATSSSDPLPAAAAGQEEEEEEKLAMPEDVADEEVVEQPVPAVKKPPAGFKYVMVDTIGCPKCRHLGCGKCRERSHTSDEWVGKKRRVLVRTKA